MGGPGSGRKKGSGGLRQKGRFPSVKKIARMKKTSVGKKALSRMYGKYA